MSFTPIPNPLLVDVKSPAGAPMLSELLLMILQELRIMNLYLYELPRKLNAGEGNVLGDEPEKLREDISPLN